VGEDSLLTEIGGVFVKIVFANDVDVVLARGLRHRPAARFNRPGQDALYLSPDETSARVAIAAKAVSYRPIPIRDQGLSRLTKHHLRMSKGEYCESSRKDHVGDREHLASTDCVHRAASTRPHER
jgi:hypothetical protein